MSLTETFPQKLWRIVNTCTTGAISWSQDGKSILINFPSFEKEYLYRSPPNPPPPSTASGSMSTPDPGEFNTKQISSFIRQLNLYGFRKSSRRHKIHEGDKSIKTDSEGRRYQVKAKFDDETDFHQYSNALFCRNLPQSVASIRRTNASSSWGKENSPPLPSSKSLAAPEATNSTSGSLRGGTVKRRRRRAKVKPGISDDRMPQCNSNTGDKPLSQSQLHYNQTVAPQYTFDRNSLIGYNQGVACDNLNSLPTHCYGPSDMVATGHYITPLSWLPIHTVPNYLSPVCPLTTSANIYYDNVISNKLDFGIDSILDGNNYTNKGSDKDLSARGDANYNNNYYTKTTIATSTHAYTDFTPLEMFYPDHTVDMTVNGSIEGQTNAADTNNIQTPPPPLELSQGNCNNPISFANTENATTTYLDPVTNFPYNTNFIHFDVNQLTKNWQEGAQRNVVFINNLLTYSDVNGAGTSANYGVNGVLYGNNYQNTIENIIYPCLPMGEMIQYPTPSEHKLDAVKKI